MTIRVAVWTSGMTASAGARAILMHPDMELVGLFSYSHDKIDRDIGALIGVDAVGIASVGSVEDHRCAARLPILCTLPAGH